MAETEQPSYLRALFNYLEPGVLIADDAAIYVDVNTTACRLFGRTADEMVGHHMSEFVDGARAAEVDVQWKAFLRDGTQSGVFGIRMPDDSDRMLQFQATANFVSGLHCSFVSEPDPVRLTNTGDLTTICAWSKRVRHAGRWMSVEDYLLLAHGVVVTHGICPDAFSTTFPSDPEARAKRFKR